MKKKSILALILALAMMLGLLAGCGGDTASETAEAPVSEETVASEAAPAEEEAPVEEAPAEEAPASAEEEPEEEVVAGPEAYYACEETTEISILFQYPAFFQAFFSEGWNSSEFWSILGEKTNTTYTLREVSNLEWSENVNLLCASGDLPDVITNMGSVYNGGLSQAIRDEMIYDLKPYVEEHAKNYFNALTKDEYTLKTCMDDEGQMGAMYPILEEAYPITNGLWIRQDWLDELGKEIPTTTDELTEILKLFSDNYGATVGLYQMVRSNTNSAFVAVEGVWNAFGPTEYYLDDDGVIQYGPMQDYYYEYLAYLKSLAQQNLFLTSSMTDQKSNDLFAKGLIGVEGDSPDNVPAYVILLPEEDQAKCKLVPMTAIGEPTEYGPVTTYVSGDAGGNISVSTNCENPEVVVKAFDYLFTEEGALLSSYGVEGETFNYNDAGEPELTELITNNPDGIPSRAAMGYWLNPGIPGYIDYARTHSSWDDVQKSSFDVWAKAYTGSSKSVSTDALTLTEDEQSAISVYRSDMITYVTEWANTVVFGDTELTDATIAEFQKTMEDTMHISEILEVYNDAYVRFQNRSLD